MYLYFNNSGELTTKIFHGEIPRQGNPLNLYVCFGLDFFDGEITRPNYVISAEFIKPDGTKVGPFNLNYQGEKQFEKLKTSEITYDLISGEFYHTYFDNISGSHFNIPGDYSLFINVYNNEKRSNGYTEKVDFFVERTIGYNQEDITIDLEQFEILQEENKDIHAKIQVLEANKVEKSDDSKIVYGTDSEGNQTTIPYSVGSTVNGNAIVVRDEENRINVNDPKNDTHAVNKRFADATYVNKDLVSYATIKDTIPMRDGYGRLNAGYPKERSHVANRGFVEDELAVLGKIKNIQGLFTEEQITLMWDALEDGRYTLNSNDYGSEIILVNKNTNDFSRITPSGKVFAYDFEEKEWKQVSGGGGGSSLINEIFGILSEDDIVKIWEKYEQGEYQEGIYTITSQMYGKELLIISRQFVVEGEVDDFGNPKDARLFKRITGEYDYTYDFELEQWEVASGGGGGTGGGNVTIIQRNPEQTVATTADNIEIKFFFRPSTGKSGTYTIYVNGAFKQSGSIESGERTLPISSGWITAGTNEVVIEIVDNATSRNSATFYITGIQLGLSSNFVESAAYTGIFEFTYTPKGEIDKNLYLYIDKGTPNEIKIEKELSSIQSGGLLTEQFKNLTHGLHTIYGIMNATINGKLIESNELNYNLIYYTSSGTDTIISSKFNTTSAEQGQLLSIDYFVYDPTTAQPTVSLFIDDELIKKQIFKGVKDSFDLTDYPYGPNVKFTLKAGNATKDFYINVKESEIKIETVKEGLALELTAFGRSNNEGSGRDNWSYGDIVAELSDFNWGSNGWISVNNETCLRLNGKADVYIPYNILEKDISINGLTVEIEYSSRDVYDINKVLLSCYSNNRGILILPNEASFKSELSTIKTKFKEDEKIKVSFIVQPNNASSLRLIKTFINGVFSGVIQYSVNDNFKQAIPEGITINANDGAIDIYSIRVYDFALTDTQILNNYIADMPLEQRMLYYNKNNIIENETVKYALVKPLIPTLTITGPLPLTKGDKKTVSVTYEVPNSFIGVCGYSFITDNVIIDIQGTSSVAYPRKNYKLKYPEPFAFYEGAVPEKVYTMKADYMESSHSHNTGNGILMTQFSPTFPTQTADNGVRNSIYGFPVVIFHKETNESLPVYYGVFNFNNDKGNSDTLGLTTDKAESWEFKDNALPLCVFDLPAGVTNFSNYFEANKAAAFEARYPEDYTNFNNLKRVINWVYTVKPDAATNNILSNPISFNFEEKIVLQQERYAEGSSTYNFYIEKDSKKQYLNISLENNTPVFKFVTDTRQQYSFDTSMNAWYVRMLGYPYYLCYYEDTKKLFAVTAYELNSGNYSKYKFVEFPEIEEGSIPSLQLVVNVTYTHTKDTKLYRQQKFKVEFSQYFNIDFCLFYYVMMDVVLAVDSRAKNMFLDTVDGQIWYPRWYDMDTTYGLDNVGYNKYGYGLEQTDYIDENNNIIDPETQTGSPVYGGVDSVLWNTFGTTFKNEIADYYIDLRDNKGLSYESILDILKGRQIDKISAAMYNTDGDFKYIGPLIEDNDVENLYIAQGSRLNHLQWWLQNRLNYLDSKYRTNDFLTDTITMRVYKVSNPVVPNTFDYDLVPYNDSYCLVRYGNDVWKEKRGKANQHTIINADTDFAPKNGQEIYIYNASKLLSIGDLSGKYAARMDFTRAFKLKELIIGNSTPGYYNDKLYELHIGNLPMLEELNITNCSALKQEIVLSNCLNIKKVYARGTKISTITFADGGNLETLELPETIASIKLLNQPFLTSFVMDGADKQYENLSTLWVENVPNIDTRPIISNARNLTRLRLVGIDWTLANFEQELLTYLASGTITGIDANGKDTAKPYLNGKIHILGRVAQRQLDIWNEYFKEYGLVITADKPEISYEVKFVNWDGTHLQTKYVLPGDTVEYTGPTPTKPPTDGYVNVFIGWDKPLTNIQQNTTITAEFRTDKPSYFYLSLDDVDYLKPTLRVNNFKGTATIDWNDNTPIETIEISYSYDITHVYEAVGNYNISLLLQGTRYSSTSYCYIELRNRGDGDSDYYNRKLIQCSLQEGVFNQLQRGLLNNSQITTFTIPASIDIVGSTTTESSDSFGGSNANCFYNCANLETVIFASENTKIGNSQAGYSNCPKLRSVVLKGHELDGSVYIPEGTTRLPRYYINNCPLISNINLPTTLVHVAYGSLVSLKGITNLSLPDSLEIIDNYSIAYIDKLESITIPKNVTTIGSSVFGGCSKLKTIYYDNDLLHWCKISTSGATSGKTLYITSFKYDGNGEVVSQEYYMPTEIIIPNEIKSIGNNQFNGWKWVEKVVLHPGVTSIGYAAFANCELLTDINLDDDVLSLGQNAFINCKELISIKLPIGLKSIPSALFSGCSKLTSVTLPKSFESIENSAFAYTAIESMILPETVTNIGSSAFASSKLKSITLPESLLLIGASAFSYSLLESITIPSQITEISHQCFYNCKELYNVVLPLNLTKIGRESFYSCSNLLELIVPENVEFIDRQGLYFGAYNKTKLVLLPKVPPVIYSTEDTYPSLPPLSYLTDLCVTAGYIDVYKSTTEYMVYTEKLKDYGIGFGPAGIQWLLLNSTNTIQVPYGNDTENVPTFSVSSSDTSILTVSNIMIDTENPGYVKFDAEALNKSGSVNVTVTLTVGDTVKHSTFNVDVYNETPSNSYTVNEIFGISYGFTYNEPYYVSENYHAGSSFALCRVDIFSYGGQRMYVDCISYGENYQDYGILSKIGCKLTSSRDDDSEKESTKENVMTTFKGLSSSTVRSIDYGILDKGSHYLYVKYIKDPSQNQYADTLQFKLRFEKE